MASNDTREDAVRASHDPGVLRVRGFPRVRATAGLMILTWMTACGGAPPPARQNGPPAVATVRDGIAEDLDTQDSAGSMFANWDAFVDPEGLPVVYEWSIGTAPGSTDLLDWTAVGGARQAAGTGLELPLATLLFVNVRAKDIAGNHSAIASSNGISVGPRIEAPSVERLLTPPRPPAANEAGGTSSVGGTPEGFATSIERHGVHWSFARATRCGRFANGDWWVVGPVDVVGIRPPSLLDQGRVKHGAMINPSPTRAAQGYDNAMFADGATGRYEPSLNVALGVDADHPLHLAPGSSLVATVSQPAPGQMPQLEGCAVLTCLAEPAPASAFRPPYCGDDKRCRWSTDALDLERLGRLSPVPHAPSLADLVDRLERTWLDHLPGHTGRYLHPRANMPDYGRDIADLIGNAALALQLDVPLAQKRPLAIALVQLGIDVYGIVHGGGRFPPDGGSGSGRKFPLLFASAVLHDEDLRTCLRDHPNAFAEDLQTFYVTVDQRGAWNGGHGGYDADDQGLAEWGNTHGDDARNDRKAWTADPFRRCCTANSWSGFVLATRIMGLREQWGHEALFDYVDRYMQIEPRGEWTRAWSPFAEQMWDRYRADS